MRFLLTAALVVAIVPMVACKSATRRAVRRATRDINWRTNPKRKKAPRVRATTPPVWPPRRGQ